MIYKEICKKKKKKKKVCLNSTFFFWEKQIVILSYIFTFDNYTRRVTTC